MRDFLALQGLLRRPSCRWILLWVFWTFVGLVFAGHYYLYHVMEGVPFHWGKAVWTVVGWYPWIVLTPVVEDLARRLPLERNRATRRVLAHLGLAFILCVAEVAFMVAVMGVAELSSGEASFDFMKTYRGVLMRSIFFDLLVYTIIVAVVHALDFYEKFRERDLRTAQLEHRLTQAQLQALRMQLNPHFLFNTLHAIHALMGEDVRGASRMLVNLSDLLRFTLEGEGVQEVPLDQELAVLERYLQIEQVRFQDRLTVCLEIEEEARDALVPNLILQPLVENAIKHGIAPFARAGWIEVRAGRQEDVLVLQVRDNGPGLGGRLQGPLREGVGIRNTRERLAQLYGKGQRLTFRNEPEGGLTVQLEIPFRTSLEVVPS